MRIKKELPTNLAENLKKLRSLKGMTQEDVTKGLHDRGLRITRQTYNRYENNNAGPDYDTLLKLADVFGTDVNYLVGFVSKQKTSKFTDDKHELDKIIAKIMGLSLEDNEEIFKVSTNDDYTQYLFTMNAKDCIGQNGRLTISKKGDIKLTDKQLLKVYKTARKIWDEAFFIYFLRILRLIKDSKPTDQSMEVFLYEMLNDRYESETIKEVQKDANTIANQLNI